MKCIYKITCKTTGKVYVGQTVDFAARRRQHLAAAKGNKIHCLLYLAMRKYGIEDFTFSIIKKGEDIDLNRLEREWIRYYKERGMSYNEKSYAGQLVEKKEKLPLERRLYRQLKERGFYEE